MPDILGGKIEINDAAAKWLGEQRQNRREEAKENAKAAPDNLDNLLRELGMAPPSDDPRQHVLTQERVDKVRARVEFTVAFEAVRRRYRGNPIKHLWFPENDDRKYELREGRPPARCDRPAHLRSLNLAIDLDLLTPEMWAKIAAVVEAKRKQRHQNKSPIQIVKSNRDFLNMIRNRKGLARG